MKGSNGAMVAYTLVDYLEPSDADLRAEWRSVIERRVPPPGERQVNFVPCEVVLCLCAMSVVDHSRFGSGSAAKAPSPIPELARLFARPNSSILAKMANLDGSRPNGGRYDSDVHDRLSADPVAREDLYRRILSAARESGIGSAELPDFLDLLGGEGEMAGTAPDTVDVRWFRGVDGQVIVDPEYVWITRQDVDDYPFPTDPLRAPRSVVRAVRVADSADDPASCLVHIVVDGAGDLPESCTAHPEAVAFPRSQMDDVRAVTTLLTPELPVDAVDAFLDALDRLENIATAQELVDSVARRYRLSGDAVEALAERLPLLDDDPRVNCGWVRGVWMIAGGSAPTDEEARISLIEDLRGLADTLPAATGVRTLFSAAAATRLSELSHLRLSELWASIVA